MGRVGPGQCAMRHLKPEFLLGLTKTLLGVKEKNVLAVIKMKITRLHSHYLSWSK